MLSIKQKQELAEIIENKLREFDDQEMKEPPDFDLNVIGKYNSFANIHPNHRHRSDTNDNSWNEQSSYYLKLGYGEEDIVKHFDYLVELKNIPSYTHVCARYFAKLIGKAMDEATQDCREYVDNILELTNNAFQGFISGGINLTAREKLKVLNLYKDQMEKIKNERLRN